MSEWTPEVRVLADLVDRVGELIRLQASQNSKRRPPEVKPYPRPVTAAQRGLVQARVDAHHALVSRVLRR